MKKTFNSLVSFIMTVSLIFNLWLPYAGNDLKVYAVSETNRLEINQSYSGFKLLDKKYIEELQATTYEFLHEQTKAKLLYLENNDDNKIFAIAFKTLPQDNTGVFHIIEHTIARGHARAFTTSDFTQYYVENINKDDFKKGVDELLDKIYNPEVLQNKNIFLREGWRYELGSAEEELKLNGIVYNEMSGKNSPFRILSKVINESLFPESRHRFNFGGEPKDIPKLTFEQFLASYKKNYVPSNSFMFLSGKLNIEKKLELINKKYLSKMGIGNSANNIEGQQPFFAMKYVEEYYPANSRSSKDSTFLALNYAADETREPELATALAILDSLLMEDASPFKKALLNCNIGTPYSMLNGSSWSLLMQTDENCSKEKFQKTVQEALINIVKNGFDQELLESVINSYELAMRENAICTKKGVRNMDIATIAWSNDENFEEALSENIQISNLRKKAKSKYFEQLIQKYFLENNHSSLVVLKPKVGLQEELAKASQKELAELKASLSKEKLNSLVQENREFLKWQEKTIQERKAVKNDLASLKKEAADIPTIVKEINGVKVLNHPIFTNGIGYIHFYYDTKKVTQDNLMYLLLLTKLLGRVDTDSILKYTGGIDFSINAYEDSKKYGQYYPKLHVSMGILNQNLDAGFKILDEIINKSKFVNKSELQKLIKQIKSNTQFELESDPLSFAASQALSCLSPKEQYDSLNYIPFYNFISDLDANYELKADEVIKKLETVSKIAFDKENLIVSYTGGKEDYLQFEKLLTHFLTKLKVNDLPIQNYKFEYTAKNQGYTLPVDVQYIAKAGDFKQLGYNSSGKLTVLNRVLEEYLFSEIRLKGGAYGEGAWINDSTIVFYSVDDPNLKETINVFNNAGLFLKNFNPSQEEMNNYIYKSIEYIDFELEPKVKGLVWDDIYIIGKTQQDILRHRDEIFSTSAADIRNYADLIDTIMKQNNLCVIGNGSKLKAEENMFEDISDTLNR